MRLWFLFVLMLFSSSNFATDWTDKKVLFINSYHDGYVWSDRLLDGVDVVLKPYIEQGLTFKTHEMDTKLNHSETSKLQAGKKAKAVIDEFQPDVVIAADDNASKYLIQPFYKDAELPFVFCGVNWDASNYDYPYKNVTGMIEVDLSLNVINQLKRYTKGYKIGVIAKNVYSEHKNIEYQQKIHSIQYHKVYLVDTVKQWKQAFLQAQSEVDILLLINPKPMDDWDDADIKAYVLDNIKIPTGTVQAWMTEFVVLGITKKPDEQGRWAAQAALKILQGKSPADIPIGKNKEGDLYINLEIANKLGILFDPRLLKTAKILR